MSVNIYRLTIVSSLTFLMLLAIGCAEKKSSASAKNSDNISGIIADAEIGSAKYLESIIKLKNRIGLSSEKEEMEIANYFKAHRSAIEREFIASLLEDLPQRGNQNEIDLSLIINKIEVLQLVATENSDQVWSLVFNDPDKNIWVTGACIRGSDIVNSSSLKSSVDSICSQNRPEFAEDCSLRNIAP